MKEVLGQRVIDAVSTDIQQERPIPKFCVKNVVVSVALMQPIEGYFDAFVCKKRQKKLDVDILGDFLGKHGVRSDK